MALPSDAGAKARRAFAKSRSKPKPFTLPSNFHTESQDAARQVVAKKKLKRAITPLQGPTRAQQQAAGPEGTRVRQLNSERVVADWRKHVRQVIRAHDQSPHGLHIAATLLQNEANTVHDQLRLRRQALDRSKTTSKRLAGARELRQRYRIPVSTVQLLTPDRLKRLNAWLKETDRSIERDAPRGASPEVLAAATANPLKPGDFLHTVGALSSIGAGKVGDFLGGETYDGRVDLTPKILKKIGTNATKDLLDLPAQTIVSLADLAHAGYELRDTPTHRRNTKPIEEIGASTKHLLLHPTEHPLAAALVLRGGLGAVDRAAGTAVRTATRGKLVGTGGRAPVKLYGKQEVNRRFATGLTTNIAQRVLDKTRPGAAVYNKFAAPVREAKRELAVAKQEYARAKETKAAPEVLKQKRQQLIEAHKLVLGRKVGHNEALPALRDRYLTKRVDEAVSAAEGQRSAAVIRARKELRATLPRKLRSALRPTIEGTIKSPETAVADIKAELRRLEAEHKAMQEAGEPRWRVRRNERQQHTFERLLENKDFLDDPTAVFEAADKFIETQRRLEAKLGEHGLLDPERALRAKLIPFAVREMGARYDPKSERLLAEDGTPLPNAQILDAMRESGVRFKGEDAQLGFISQRGDLGRLGDYFKDSTKQPSGYFQKRTGESARSGLHNLHFKMVEAQLTHSINVLAQAEQANAILDRFGLKPKGDMAFTDYKVAANAAREASDRSGMNWVPVRIGQAVGEQLRAIHEHIDPAAVEMLPESAQLPGKPAWLVMPSTVAGRFKEHADSLGSNTFQLGFQALTHAFRQTVLPLSPRWLAGNIVELVVRGAVEGTGPLAWAVGHSVLKRMKNMDEGAYDAFVAEAQSGALYASQVRQDHYIGIERWTDRGLATHFAKPIIYGFHHKLSPVKYPAWLYHKYASAIKWITPRIEKEFQAAAIGKAALHEMRDMNGNWLNALPHWTGALDDVAHGLLNTNKQIQFAEYVDKVVGRYNKLSPSGRRVVSGYMPFAMWYANAVRFVFVTLPKDHPIIQGWIAAGYVHTEKERLKEGKSLTQPIPGGKERLPDFLQGTITKKDGSHFALQHYTPWGAFSDVGSLQGLVVPQLNALPLALAGKNWKLEDLRGSPGTDLTSFQERLKLGMYTATEALLPGLAVARRVREQGGSAYDNSTLLQPKVKAGTKVGYFGSQGSLRKVADPFRSYPSSSAHTGPAKAPRSAGGNRFLQRQTNSRTEEKTPNRFLQG